MSGVSDEWEAEAARDREKNLEAKIEAHLARGGVVRTVEGWYGEPVPKTLLTERDKNGIFKRELTTESPPSHKRIFLI